MTDGLCRLLAPLMPHTADEAYRALHKAAQDSEACVHVETFLHATGVGVDPEWAKVMEVRTAALLAMEKMRQEIKERDGAGNPNIKAVEAMDVGVVLPDPDGILARFDLVDLADLLGVSLVRLDKSATEVRVEDRRNEPQCERSWKRDGTVKRRADGGMLTDRDAEAVGVGVA